MARRLAPLALTLVVLCGCGSHHLTADQYRSKVTALCTANWNAQQALAKRFFSHGSALKELSRETTVVDTRYRAGLRALSVPTEYKRMHRQLLTLLAAPRPRTPAADRDHLLALRDAYGVMKLTTCRGYVDQALLKVGA